MTDDPRYPIGRYAPPDVIDAVTLASWTESIASAPGRVREAVAGLDAGQLDTPYRDGGWTVRQVTHHLPDSHMHAYLRFKWALTEDRPVVPGYDEARWAALNDSLHGPVEPALALLEALHTRWLALIASTAPADFERRFVNPRNGAERSLGWLLGLYAWHGAHHTAQVTALRARRGW
jgi:uncharacterized damage-inducible protein DinB